MERNSGYVLILVFMFATFSHLETEPGPNEH